MDAIIDQVVEHAPDVREFRLRRADGAPWPAWQPGAHVVLHVAAADGTQYERHYSIVGMADAGTACRIVVQRAAQGRGGSRTLHDGYAPGSRVAVSGPYDSFALAPAAAPPARVVLVAGGIGITPLVAMARALGEQGRETTLHYLARNRRRLVLLDEVAAIPHATVHTHLSEEGGRVDPRALLGAYGPGDTLYACGPVSLLQDLADAARERGWPAGAVHVESFGAGAGAGDVPLTVELALSGQTVRVMPGTSILDALVAADVFASYDCKRGECASCYTPVLAGMPVHRDVCLTPAMRREGMCTCVSWAAAPGHLVLDL